MNPLKLGICLRPNYNFMHKAKLFQEATFFIISLKFYLSEVNIQVQNGHEVL